MPKKIMIYISKNTHLYELQKYIYIFELIYLNLIYTINTSVYVHKLILLILDDFLCCNLINTIK